MDPWKTCMHAHTHKKKKQKKNVVVHSYILNPSDSETLVFLGLPG